MLLQTNPVSTVLCKKAVWWTVEKLPTDPVVDKNIKEHVFYSEKYGLQ
jgi:hypothetical protein